MTLLIVDDGVSIEIGILKKEGGKKNQDEREKLRMERGKREENLGVLKDLKWVEIATVI